MLRTFLLDNSAWDLILASSLAGGSLLLVWLVRAFARRKWKHAAGTVSDVDDFLLDLARRTKLFLLFFPAVYLGMRVLDVPPELRALVRLASALTVIAQVAIWITTFLDFWIRRYHRSRIETDPGAVMTMQVFRIGGVAAIWIIATIVAIDTLGFKVTTLIAGLGIGGIAVALATQNMLSDLFASLSIVMDKPFVLGDPISVDNHSGTVEHIGLKTTRIRATGGEELIFSNGDLLKSRIRNFKRMSERRATAKILVAFGTPADALEKIPGLMRAAVEKQPLARFDRAHFAGFGDMAYDFELVYFVTGGEYAVYMDVQQAVNLAIVRAFESEGVRVERRHH